MKIVWWSFALIVCVSDCVLSDKAFTCRFKQAGYHLYAQSEIPHNVIPYFLIRSDTTEKFILPNIFDIFWRKKSLFLTYADFLWPNGRVPVVFHRDISKPNVEKILNILQIFHNYTCIKIEKKTDEDEDYVKIKIGSDMWSYIGRIGGKQEVSIRSVDPYDVLHVFMHVLGFVHQHQAENRDEFIDLNVRNIKKGLEKDFEIIQGLDQSFGTYYDYISVTHYYSRLASQNRFEDSIIPLDPNVDLGWRSVLSQGDIWKVKAMYQCENFLNLDVDCD